MVEVVNRQRRKKLDTELWRELASKMLALLNRSDAEVTIAFFSDLKIRTLNRTFRGINKATDVLSFPAVEGEVGQLLGDIAISIDRAEEQAKQNGLTLDQEVSQLLLHGLLHLCGHDHETDNGEMNRLELQLRRKLGI